MARRPVDADPDDTAAAPQHRDLAEAIVNLAKVAQMRRHARRELLESTAVVAAAIRKQLRSGDEVDLDAWELPVSSDSQAGRDDIRALDGEGVSFRGGFGAEGPRGVLSFRGGSYRSVRLFDGRGELRQVLALDSGVGDEMWGVLEGVDGGSDPRAFTSPDLPHDAFRRATAGECTAFAFEADQVIAAFRDVVRDQAISFAGAAQRLTKLAVR